MFEPWRLQVEKTITVEELYGTVNPPIPTGFRGIAFRPAKRGEKWLGKFSDQAVTACGDYSEDCPVIILASALTETEELYGEGATPKSVWAKYCPSSERSKYGKPGVMSRSQYVGRDIAYIHPKYGFRAAHGGLGLAGFVYALKMNDWQILYGEEITDAKALEAKLRAERRLPKNMFIEAGLRVPEEEEEYVAEGGLGFGFCAGEGPALSILGGRRAIVGTRKRKYLKVPITKTGVVEVTDYDGQTYFCLEDFPGAEIVEE